MTPWLLTHFLQEILEGDEQNDNALKVTKPARIAGNGTTYMYVENTETGERFTLKVIAS